MTKLSTQLHSLVYDEILESSARQLLFFNSWVSKNVLIAMSGYKDSGFNGTVFVV